MNAKRAPRKSAGRPPRARAGRVVEATAEEKHHLVEDIAYFRAERYRNVEPGKYREEDRLRAESEIKAVLRRRRKG
jgi:hypothetical protein